ncbi:DNA damage-binding protein 1 [Dorcoceras hygrometricum]|uniref:DNA damage-binding protein 1 n=1 Tax=Dorcoceras hygrometricum TaxID=472368 RepID=A0A2Z7CN89_9LAMI|nr:DNA damage-binding protein 1 [Dorcoceras hygrometricum]
MFMFPRETGRSQAPRRQQGKRDPDPPLYANTVLSLALASWAAKQSTEITYTHSNIHINAQQPSSIQSHANSQQYQAQIRTFYFCATITTKTGPRDLDSNLLNTQHIDLKSCTKLTANYRCSRLGATINQLNYYQNNLLEANSQQETRSQAKTQKLCKRSPMLPQLSKTTAGNDGNHRIKSMVNSALGFETQRKNVGENILSMGSDISIEDQVFLYINPVAAEIYFKQIHRQKPAGTNNQQMQRNQLLKSQTTLNKTKTHSLRHPVASSCTKHPDTSYSNHYQLQATVANKSLVAGQPDAGSK